MERYAAHVSRNSALSNTCVAQVENGSATVFYANSCQLILQNPQVHSDSSCKDHSTTADTSKLEELGKQLKDQCTAVANATVTLTGEKLYTTMCTVGINRYLCAYVMHIY